MKLDAENYNEKRDIYSPVVMHGEIVCGYWMTGQDYRNKSGYYGAYPPNYLKRLALLLPNPKLVLHVFSGKVELGSWGKVTEITFDINPELHPTVVGNAEKLTEYFDEGTFDLIVLDPPYLEHHVDYGTEKVNKRKVLKECAKLLIKGGFLVWLDVSIPMWAKVDGWRLRGTIGMTQSTNHATRTITILEKVI